MTSNQLSYWKLKEEERSNKAREAETHRANTAKESLTATELNEVQRHNLSQEELTKLQRDLDAKGLDIKSKQQLLDIWDMYGKYGTMSLDQMPEDVRVEIWNSFGYDGNKIKTDPGATSNFASLWGELKSFWNSISRGISRGLGSSLF